MFVECQGQTLAEFIRCSKVPTYKVFFKNCFKLVMLQLWQPATDSQHKVATLSTTSKIVGQKKKKKKGCCFRLRNTARRSLHDCSVRKV